MGEKCNVEIISSKTLCKQPGRYIGWPTIGKTPDGTLLTVYYQQERAGEKTCLMLTRWRLR